MSLHVYPGEVFILDNRLAIFGERNCHFGVVTLSASLFFFSVLDRRC